MNRFVFTCGDINGIGPEICIKTFNIISKNIKNKIIFLCPENVFNRTVDNIFPKFKYEIIKSDSLINKNPSIISIISLGKPRQSLGKPTATSGKISYEAINKGVDLVKRNLADAIITAPISKVSFEKAAIPFPGHTELLAELTNTKNFVMMFLSESFKTAMLTIHIPIRKVSSRITKISIIKTIRVVENSLKKDFLVKNPKIAVLGLNPHAGEEGRIGFEEINTVQPIIKNYKECFVDGPFVSDAFFGNRSYKNYDITIGAYHDQVLIPFKLLNFSSGVNFTAGLPIIRTSPDHGTAFDICKNYIADCSSMVSAVKWAKKILINHKKNG